MIQMDYVRSPRVSLDCAWWMLWITTLLICTLYLYPRGNFGSQETVASILEVHTSAPHNATTGQPTSAPGQADDAATPSSKTSSSLPPPPFMPLEQEPTAEEGGERNSAAEGSGDSNTAKGDVLVLQARSRTETMLWAKVLQVRCSKQIGRLG